MGPLRRIDIERLRDPNCETRHPSEVRSHCRNAFVDHANRRGHATPGPTTRTRYHWSLSNDQWDLKDPRTPKTLNLLPEIASNEDLSTQSLIAQGTIQSRVIAVP